MIIISTVELIADYLVTQSKGTLGTDLFCYKWSNNNNGILVTTTGGMNPDRFLDGNNNRISYTFINILIRSMDMETALHESEELIDLFEKNIVTGCIRNKPRRDEPIFVGQESTENGLVNYFGLDLIVLEVKHNL